MLSLPATSIAHSTTWGHDGPVKRLVVCCDGTWAKPDNKFVTNVEKIARTIQIDSASAGGVPQLVYYISGVGSGSFAADRLLGGAFGFGLSHNVIACYRFLAQNYEPGDELFIFGFSRGAYTARSLAGMIAKVGLLTRRSLVEERLRDAVHIYQRERLAEGSFGASTGEFTHDHCYAPRVRFLGVFDTVGALGVPGFRWRTPKFHDVALSDQVDCARHALAIDETRLIFAPTLWELPDGAAEGTSVLDGRVKQVWFEGAHSDVGGGYEESGLSDTALLWMAREARREGLIFDVSLLSLYINSGSDPIRHSPLNALYRVYNAILQAKMSLLRRNHAPEFREGLRILGNERALSVRVASSAMNHFQAATFEPTNPYEPTNLQNFAEATGPSGTAQESVTALPEADVDLSTLAA